MSEVSAGELSDRFGDIPKEIYEKHRLVKLLPWVTYKLTQEEKLACLISEFIALSPNSPYPNAKRHDLPESITQYPFVSLLYPDDIRGEGAALEIQRAFFQAIKQAQAHSGINELNHFYAMGWDPNLRTKGIIIDDKVFPNESYVDHELAHAETNWRNGLTSYIVFSSMWGKAGGIRTLHFPEYHVRTFNQETNVQSMKSLLAPRYPSSGDWRYANWLINSYYLPEWEELHALYQKKKDELQPLMRRCEDRPSQTAQVFGNLFEQAIKKGELVDIEPLSV